MADPNACPFAATFELIRGKWTYCILVLLAERTRGFNELLRLNPELTPKVLAQRLRELEEDGIVSRRVVPTRPPSSEYDLSALGHELLPLMLSIERWGRDYLSARQQPAMPA
ncbi:winged helix-turn-helix transcriptional regulator [Sorangium sp. So ce1099]|uniref:winged helix-turn-helix transcriptional regulator n=1 Tax=Sorangium sp. So ce1099 TaxID=3133331 RepID=UPI003F5DB70C